MKTYEEQLQDLVESKASRKEVVDFMRKHNDELVDFEEMKVNHNWVDRGAVMSCEGGNHPPHRVFKQRK